MDSSSFCTLMSRSRSTEARIIERDWNEKRPSNEYIVEVLKHESVYALGVLAMEIMIGREFIDKWIDEIYKKDKLFELPPHPYLDHDEGCFVKHRSDL